MAYFQLMRTAFAIILLMVLAAPAKSQPLTGKDDPFAAAIRLKTAHVRETWNECRERGATEKRCKSLLKIIHKRELAVLEKLVTTIANKKVNRDRFGKELIACALPNNGLSPVIDCWERLLDRMQAALNGEFLVLKP